MLVFALELGMTHERVNLYEMDWGPYIAIEAGVQAGPIKLFGEVTSYQDPVSLQGSSPYRVDYTVGMVAKWKAVELGATHTCLHHVDSAEDERPWISGGSQRVFIRVTK